MGRYLRGELIQARKAGIGEIILRACRRHPAIAALLGLVAVLFGVLTIGATLAVVRIQHAEQFAVAERNRAAASLRLSQLSEAEGLRRARQPRFRQLALEKVLAAGTPEESVEMHVDRRSEAIASLAMPSLHHAALPPGPTGWSLVAVAPGHGFSAWRDPRGEGWLVTRAGDGVVVSSNRLGAIPTRLSRDGRRLVTQDSDRNQWQLWDISTQEAQLKRVGPGLVEDLSDDGHLVASHWTDSNHNEIADVTEVPEGRLRFRLEFPRVSVKMRFNGEGTLCAIAPSSYLNDSTFPFSVRVHRCDNGSVHRELSSGLGNCIWAMEFSRDGEWLAAGERGGATYVWEIRTGNARHVFRGTGAEVWQLAFSEDSRLLATISEGRLLTLYDTVGGQPVARAGEAWQSQRVPLLSWSAKEPRTFGPISQDGQETFLTLKSGAYSSFVAPDSHGSALGIDIAQDGRWLAVGDSRHARLWDLRRSELHDTFAQGLWNSFAFSPDGRWLFGAGEPGVFRWEMTMDGIRPASRTQLMPAGWHNAVTLDSTGRFIAAESGDTGKIGLFSQRKDECLPFAEFDTGAVSWISLSSDGGRLAVAGWDGLNVWSTTTRSNLFSSKTSAHWVDFSPDGRWLVVGRERYEILKTSDWVTITTLDSRTVGPHQCRAAFTPDGRWLATGHPFGKIALWKAPAWDRVGVLESPSGNPVGRFTFDAAGDNLYNATTGGVIESWDLKLLATELQALGLGW